MRAYADSSFILRLITGESGSTAAIGEYRRLKSPRLFFLPLHALEIENAIGQRAFFQRHSIPSGERGQVTRERDAALSRLLRLKNRRALVDVAVDMDAAIEGARSLSKTHAEKIGARAMDLLQVSCALALKSEIFLTCDERQFHLAKAEGLKATFVAPD